MEPSGTIFSIFGLALLAPWIYRIAGRVSGPILSLLPFALALYFFSDLSRVASGPPIASAHSWVPSLGVRLALAVDGWSALFALLITVIGGFVLVYAGSYLDGEPKLGRFYSHILLFMGSMLGLVLADNFLVLFVFWELTSFSSYFLIGFDHERESARSGALQALLVTSGGGLALMAGFLLLGQAAGTFEISESLGRGDAIRAHPLYAPILVLILVGAFTKSAQFPFHFWLPNAMEAPTPVSAYLHSATMVKAGVYLLGRLSPVLGGTALWADALTGFGAVTMLLTGWLGLRQSDLKRILAYSTVSALGLMTFLIGLNTTAAAIGMVVFLLGHALYKGGLFLVAGIVDHETGTRDVTRVRGLRHAMPVTAIAGSLAALSMAGLPPFFGFFGKETAYEALLHGAARWQLVAAVLANVLFFALAAVVLVKPFFGKQLVAPKRAHEAPAAMWIGPLALGSAGLALGLMPGATSRALVQSAAGAIAGAPPAVELAPWHGWTPALLLSLATFAAGGAIYGLRERFVRRIAWFVRAERWGPERWYEWSLRALNEIARVQTRVLQNGYLRYYLLATVGASGAVVAFALWRLELGLVFQPSGLQFYDLALALLVFSAAVATTLLNSRLGAVAALGVAGYGIALIFILFGAPDLAMTQFLFETLMVILFVLVFYFLPRFAILSSTRTRVRDMIVSVLFGGLMTVLVWIALQVQLHPTISGYFVENSYRLGHGRNIVNVILVDFRALDTLGEITVLAIAGIGVFALLKMRAAKEDK